MSVKGTILENYHFDARDFTDAHLEDLATACHMRKGNKELQSKLRFAIEYQQRSKMKYSMRIEQAREEAFMKYRRHENLKLFRVPQWICVKYDSAKSAAIEFAKANLLSDISVFKEDRTDWPEIIVPPMSMTAPHLIASLPPECVNLTGWERLKKAFLPSRYVKNYNEKDPTHTYNLDAFFVTTAVAALACGLGNGYINARKDLHIFKKDATKLHESRYRAFRAREFAFFKSFGKYYFRWGWRIGFLCSTVYAISQSMAIYKLQDKVHHYVIGTAVPGALYNWKLGFAGMWRSGLLMAVLIGLPMGFICAKLGYNPRVYYYYTRVEPKVQGPMTENGMTPLELLRSYERRLAILDLLRSPVSDEINNPEFYRDFAGTE